MRRRAIFRCDSGPRVGAGHVMRCLALASALGDLGWESKLVGPVGSAELVSALFDSRAGAAAITIVESHDADIPQALRGLQPEGCELLVIDSYRLNADYAEALDGWYGQLLFMDDRPTRRLPSGVLLDPTFARHPQDYWGFAPASMPMMLGPDYALLRPEFAQMRRATLKVRQERREPLSILLSLGGMPDPALVRLIAEGCGRVSQPTQIMAVVAPSAGLVDMNIGRSSLKVVPLSPDMHRLVADADLAIGAGGGSAWERCCLGLPSLVVEIADNQADICAALSDAGAALSLGKAANLTPERVADHVTRLMDSQDQRLAMSAKAALICDGLGARRVALALSPMIARDGRPVHLRPAKPEDAALMFEWQQIPEIRRFTPNPKAPVWGEHLAWLERRLAAPQHGPFTIIMHGTTPVGVLRLDLAAAGNYPIDADSEALVVSILVDPAHQSLGIAQAALATARLLVPYQPLLAEIQAGNIASRRLFSRAGYTPLGEDVFCNQPVDIFPDKNRQHPRSPR